MDLHICIAELSHGHCLLAKVMPQKYSQLLSSRCFQCLQCLQMNESERKGTLENGSELKWIPKKIWKKFMYQKHLGDTWQLRVYLPGYYGFKSSCLWQSLIYADICLRTTKLCQKTNEEMESRQISTIWISFRANFYINLSYLLYICSIFERWLALWFTRRFWCW